MIKTEFSGQTAMVRLQLRFKPQVSREKSIRERRKEGSKSPKLGQLSKTKKRRQDTQAVAQGGRQDMQAAAQGGRQDGDWWGEHTVEAGPGPFKLCPGAV